MHAFDSPFIQLHFVREQLLKAASMREKAKVKEEEEEKGKEKAMNE